MKINEPIGNPVFAGLFVRIPLSIYLVVAGLYGMKNSLAFAEGLKKLSVLPEPIASLHAFLLPYSDILAGVMLFTGSWTTLGSLIVSIMLLPLVAGFGVFDHRFINKDLILLGASLSLMFSGPGAFSIDRFRKSG